MDNFLRMLGVTALLCTMMVCGIYASCVDDLKAELQPCFDQLKNNMQTEAPSDVNNFLCGVSQKDRLECVIKIFNKCPEFSEQAFVNDLKHSTSGFTAQDLFHTKSANEFCKCAPTFKCLQDIQIERLALDMTEGPWEQIANQEYICELGTDRDIACVASSLPICEDFLQYKHNETLKAANKKPDEHMFDIGNFEYASTYAENHCKNYAKVQINHDCSMKRVGWSSVSTCYNQVPNLVSETGRRCAMRTCVERAMVTCPKDDMAYFIDAVNIFNDIKIETERSCPSSASATTIYQTVIMLAITMYLFFTDNDIIVTLITNSLSSI